MPSGRRHGASGRGWWRPRAVRRRRARRARGGGGRAGRGGGPPDRGPGLARASGRTAPTGTHTLSPAVAALSSPATCTVWASPNPPERSRASSKGRTPSVVAAARSSACSRSPVSTGRTDVPPSSRTRTTRSATRRTRSDPVPYPEAWASTRVRPRRTGAATTGSPVRASMMRSTRPSVGGPGRSRSPGCGIGARRPMLSGWTPFGVVRCPCVRGGRRVRRRGNDPQDPHRAG